MTHQADQAVRSAPPEGTRAALIDAGFALFGSGGYAATSTRDIAARAGTNVASIAYHFGGKHGLRLACADEFARRTGAAFDRAPTGPAETPAAARAGLHGTLESMATFLLGDGGAGDMVGFVLRELAEDSETVGRIYARLIEPSHLRLCRLWSLATGEAADTAAVRLRMFSLIGQLMYFRIGAPVVRRRMQWAAIGADERRAIVQVLRQTLDAMLQQATKEVR